MSAARPEQEAINPERFLGKRKGVAYGPHLDPMNSAECTEDMRFDEVVE